MGKLDFFKIKKKKSASKDTIGKADAPCTLARGRMGNLFGDPIYRSSARHTARLRYSTGDHGRGPFLPPPPPQVLGGALRDVGGTPSTMSTPAWEHPPAVRSTSPPLGSREDGHEPQTPCSVAGLEPSRRTVTTRQSSRTPVLPTLAPTLVSGPWAPKTPPHVKHCGNSGCL